MLYFQTNYHTWKIYLHHSVGLDDKSGENLLYGDPFYLQLIDADANGKSLALFSSLKMMNLQNVRKNPHNYFRNGEINQSVGVSCMQQVDLIYTILAEKLLYGL